MKYKFAETDFSIVPKEEGEKPDVFDLESAAGSPPFKFLRNPGRPGSLPGPVKTYRFPDEAQTWFQNTGFLSEFES